MYEIFTHGTFEVDPEHEHAFIDAWSEFASLVSRQPGAGTLRLLRDVRHPGRFFSLGEWDDAEAIAAWKSSPDFKERLGRVVGQASSFEPTEQVTLRKVAGGTVEALSPPEGLEAIHAPG